MKTEEIEKEARLFNKEDECYIHVQRCNDGPFTQLLAGDPKVLLQAVFNIISELETDYDVSFRKQMKIYRYAQRTFRKNPERRYTPIGIEEEKEGD